MTKNNKLFLQILFVGFLVFSLVSVNQINKAIESKFNLHREAKKCERKYELFSKALERAIAAKDDEAIKVIDDMRVEVRASCDDKNSYQSSKDYDSAISDVYFNFGIIMAFFLAIALIPFAWNFVLSRITEIGDAFRGDKK